MELNVLLTHHTLFFDSEYESIASLFCNITGYDKSKTKNRVLLKSWFDGYIFTTTVGFLANQRESFKNRTEKSRTWSRSYLEQYKFLIGLLLSRKDILNEINILSYDQLIENTDSIDETLNKIKSICDEYSNGGLKYLSDLYEKDNSIFDDYNSLYQIIQSIAK